MAVAPDQHDEYELVLMLDPEAPDERRDEITANARQRIEGKGELKDERAWGMRKLAYEIRQRTEADYRFFRFQTDSPLLDELNHNLKITDGVLRFRIFKVDPRSPVIEPPPPVALAGAATRAPGPRRSQAGAPPAADAPAPEEPVPVAEDAPAPAAAPEEGPAAVEQSAEAPAETEPSSEE